MTIKIACETKHSLPLADLTCLQGDLKTLSDENKAKLRKQIVEKGFIAPFFVWKNEENGKVINYIIDGHQREVVLKDMASEGEELPGAFPVVYIEAKDERDAKEKLLAINSQYGKMTEESLFNFAEEPDFQFKDLGDFEFAGIDMEGLEGLFDEANEPEHTDEDNICTAKKNEIIVDNEEEFLEQFDRFIVSFSGGKDSTFLLLWALENLPKEKISVLYWDSGLNWEEEYQFLQYMCSKNDLESIVCGYKDAELIEKTVIEKGYPFYGNLWCQSLLKIHSLARAGKYIEEKYGKILLLNGIRHAEAGSANASKRGQYPRFYMEGSNKKPMFCPLIKETDEDLIAYIQKHNEKILPLYKWANRTGCWFCPNSDVKIRAYIKIKHPVKLVYINELLCKGMKNKVWKEKKFEDLFIFFNSPKELVKGSFSDIAFTEEEFKIAVQEQQNENYKKSIDLRD